MLILNHKELAEALPMGEAIEAVEEAFRLYHEGRTVTPLRVPLETTGGVILYMPSFLEGFRGPGALGVKVVSVYSGNPGRGLPLIYAAYLLNDPATGEPLALLEGSYLTGVRTGAASALAVRYLSREDSASLGIIGTGFQAFFQVWAISLVRKLERVLLYDQVGAKAEELAGRLSSELGLKAEVEVMASPEPLVRGSDIIVTATTSKTPVFAGEQVPEGTTVIAIGAFTPDAREVDDALIRKAKIYVDSYEGALAEAGDLLIPMEAGILKREEIRGELAELVAGAVPGREAEDEVILFKSVGLAIEDAAVARVAYERALARGLGAEVELL